MLRSWKHHILFWKPSLWHSKEWPEADGQNNDKQEHLSHKEGERLAGGWVGPPTSVVRQSESSVKQATSHLLPNTHPMTRRHWLDVPNCYNHKGSREKCATQHPPGKMDNHRDPPCWQLYFQKAPSCLSHFKIPCTKSQTPSHLLSPVWSLLNNLIITSLNPIHYFIVHSSLSAVGHQLCFPSTAWRIFFLSILYKEGATSRLSKQRQDLLHFPKDGCTQNRLNDLPIDTKMAKWGCHGQILSYVSNYNRHFMDRDGSSCYWRRWFLPIELARREN